MIKGKTPEEIRKTFNIKNDFTPSEEEQVRKENEWSEEKQEREENTSTTKIKYEKKPTSSITNQPSVCCGELDLAKMNINKKKIKKIAN